MFLCVIAFFFACDFCSILTFFDLPLCTASGIRHLGFVILWSKRNWSRFLCSIREEGDHWSCRSNLSEKFVFCFFGIHCCCKSDEICFEVTRSGFLLPFDREGFSVRLSLQLLVRSACKSVLKSLDPLQDLNLFPILSLRRNRLEDLCCSCGYS